MCRLDGREIRPFFPLLGREICVVNPGLTIPIVRLLESYWTMSGLVSLSDARANSGNSYIRLTDRLDAIAYRRSTEQSDPSLVANSCKL